MSKPKQLLLTLKKKWFDMISAGQKREEYREIKPWIMSRLQNRDYEQVRFENGYGPNVPVCIVKFDGWRIGTGRKEWGAGDPEKPVVIIQLGAVVKCANKSESETMMAGNESKDENETQNGI